MIMSLLSKIFTRKGHCEERDIFPHFYQNKILNLFSSLNRSTIWDDFIFIVTPELELDLES